MQPTPAPSSHPRSPEPVNHAEETVYPAPPQNKGSAPFSVLSGLFTKLSTERKPERRRRLLNAWFTHWRAQVGYDLYPVLRLLLPQKDRERAVYGLKEKNLAKTYIKLIPLGMKDPDAVRLLNWKRPSGKFSGSGDFSNVLYEVVSKRSSVVDGSLSIEDLNGILDELAQNMGKQEVQSKILQRIYNRTTAEEQKWIVRIVLKDMVISVKENTVLSVFHPDAEDLFNTCSDLKKVAWELSNPTRRLNAEDKAIQLFRAFAPMLCKRPKHKIEESVKDMQGRTFFIEEKLDGERIQLHKRGNEYFYCSRKGKDYTNLYGKHVVGEGSLTPHIDAAFDDRVEEIILDGEMLVWDPVSERNLPFGTLKTAALDKSKAEARPRPCFKVFDLLYLNGMSLDKKSLKFRKRNLRACIQPVPGRLEFVVEFEGKTAKDVRQRMDEIMETRGEGLILKHPDSEYTLNGRNKDWIKVKPEYMDDMGETVDVLVVAGNYGTRKRSGGVSTLICAVLDDRHEGGEPRYSSFVRIGSGLSFADYAWIRQKPWKPWDPKNPPEFLQTAKRSHEDKGDIYIEPADSFILRVKAAEITHTDQYHLGLTMRFPRALTIRDDLTTEDCMTASALLETFRTERKRKMEKDASFDDRKKKRKTTAKKPTVLPRYQGPSADSVKVESDLFEGMKFMVSADPKSKTGEEDRKELMKMIYAQGGSCVQVVTSQQPVMVVYGGTTIPYDIKVLINKGTVDIVRPQWILDCVARDELVTLKKRYFFHASEDRRMSAEYNEPNSEDEEMDDEERKQTSREQVASLKISATPECVEAKVEEPAEDPALADWLTVDTKQTVTDDSATEPESDADSVNDDVDKDIDEWIAVEPSGSDTLDSFHVSSLSEEKAQKEPEDVSMGEALGREYDTSLIFKHLFFYIDSPENARKNEMVVNTKYEKEISNHLLKVSRSIEENGGKVVDLDDPKLTHVALDKRDVSRRVTLMQLTSKPKRRRLVISDYIQACLGEETLLDEEEFAP
ncbi:ATP dependent DNA ligase domain containing protein [Tylopilus felleus]